MLFSLSEIFDIVFMVFIIGFIFKDILSAKNFFNNPYKLHETSDGKYFAMKNNAFIEDMKTAIIVVGPAIILHELGHKFVAMAFGFNATFHAAYSWLIIALLLKLLNFGFIFVVPAYVQTSCASAVCLGKNFYLDRSLIALAGPFVNFSLWIISKQLLNHKKFVKKHSKFVPILMMTSKINFYLMIFNLIPIPGFDGYNFITNLFAWIGSVL